MFDKEIGRVDSIGKLKEGRGRVGSDEQGRMSLRTNVDFPPMGGSL